jgi:hypothetical protein
MRIFALSLVIEGVSVGLAYCQFKLLSRLAIYSFFYIWPIDRVIEPAMRTAGLSTRGFVFGVLVVGLFVLNSLKWFGVQRVRESGRTRLALFFLLLLVLSTLVSFSLAGVAL